MFTLTFWKAALERALKTAAQVLLSVYFVGDVALNAFQADWGNMLGLALGGVVFSILTSVATGVLTDGGPSLGNVEKLAE